jgi:hypothetical protein
MNYSGPESCPLCETFDRIEIKSIPYREIWSALHNEWNASFSIEVIQHHSPLEFTKLVECRNCGLQYFIPTVCGDSQFYYELSKSPMYYNTELLHFLMVT